MPSPRLLVAMPTRGSAYVPSLLEAQRVAQRFDGELRVEIGRPIELVRTRIVTRFLEGDADYLLTIDDDIVAPADAADRLLALDAAVATAPCPIALEGRIVANVKAAGSGDWIVKPEATVFPVGQTGLGFVLTRRDVFGTLRTPWFQFGAATGGRVIGEDVWFSNGVLKAGFEILCDGSVHCSHYKEGLDLLKLAAW